MKKAAAPTIFAVVVLLAVAVTADAQQSGKVFRIGFLDNGTASGIAVLLDVFRQELTKLGWIEGKTLPSSTDLLKKKLSACLSSLRTWFVSGLI
jgi:hypothetical protein